MPLDSAVVGASIPAQEHHVDARWLMAYAASLADYNPLYMDTAAHAVQAHPVFPVCLEWPVILNTRAIAATQSLTQAEAARGVHASHDLHLYKPITQDQVLATAATMIGVRQIKPGAAYTMRLDTHDQAGDLVARTYQLGIYRGVDVQGSDRFSEEPPALPAWHDPSNAHAENITIPAGAAHTYTECARIFNPIHTDRQIALNAGLPDIILHGTATLALAISQLVNRYADGKPSQISRLGGRFAAMVLMPSTITLESREDQGVISYQVRTEQGDLAIANGFVCLR